VATIAAETPRKPARHRHEASLDRRDDDRVTSWQDFYAATVGQPLLARLDEYPDALLIDGCDWSATTAVTRLFKRLPCFADSSWSHDDELDGALLLAGLRTGATDDRHCFQTSYLREDFREYFAHERYRLIWIVREPRAAVCSLLGAWEKALPRRAASGSIDKSAVTSRLEKACSTYLASIGRTLEIKERLGDRVVIIDYDELARERIRLLPALCEFASVACDSHLLRHLHGKSVRKGVLASWEATVTDQLTLAAYRRARHADTLSLQTD